MNRENHQTPHKSNLQPEIIRFFEVSKWLVECPLRFLRVSIYPPNQGHGWIESQDQRKGEVFRGAHFRVSPRFVNDMIILRRETGSLEPKAQGHGGKVGKLRGHEDWVRHRLARNGDLTLDELVLELAERGVTVHRSAVGKLLHRLGFSHKKPARQ